MPRLAPGICAAVCESYHQMHGALTWRAKLRRIAIPNSQSMGWKRTLGPVLRRRVPHAHVTYAPQNDVDGAEDFSAKLGTKASGGVRANASILTMKGNMIPL